MAAPPPAGAGERRVTRLADIRPTPAVSPCLGVRSVSLRGAAADVATLAAACAAAGWTVVASGGGLVVDLDGSAAAGPACRFEDPHGEPALSEPALRRVWERPPYSMVVRLVGGGVPSQWARIGTRGRRAELRARVVQSAALLLTRALRGLPACGPAPTAPPGRGISADGATWRGWLSWQAARWESRLCAEWWSIGVVDQPIGHVIRDGSLGRVRWLHPRAGRAYWADPFTWPGTDRILAEEFSLSGGPGTIVALRPQARGWQARGWQAGGWQADRTLLADRWHHSYPFTFRDGDEIYLLPESAAQGCSMLYRLASDGRLTPVVCIAERALADATLFRHGGRYWVAATDLAIGPHDNLCLFSSDRLAGPWGAHPGNPVKLDISSSRPGGTPFVVGGRLYRPAQDCARTYGAAVVISEVITLSEDTFVEHEVLRLAPERGGKLPHGLHTLSDAGPRTLVDGKRMVLAPGLAVRKLAGRLRLRRPRDAA